MRGHAPTAKEKVAESEHGQNFLTMNAAAVRKHYGDKLKMNAEMFTSDLDGLVQNLAEEFAKTMCVHHSMNIKAGPTSAKKVKVKKEI